MSRAAAVAAAEMMPAARAAARRRERARAVVGGIFYVELAVVSHQPHDQTEGLAVTPDGRYVFTPRREFARCST